LGSCHAYECVHGWRVSPPRTQNRRRLRLPAKYFGKTARHSFGGAVTTKAYPAFDAIKQIIIPGPPIKPIEPQRGSWSVNYSLRQYIIERGRRDGWGAFGHVSFADSDTSPITTFFDSGLGGNGLFASRAGDEFGVSCAYADVSDELQDNLNLLLFGGRRLRVEHALEAFYNVHVTPWLQLTGDCRSSGRTVRWLIPPSCPRCA
jgi:porin